MEPAPAACTLGIGGGEGGVAVHADSHLVCGFASGLVFAFAGSVQSVCGAGRGYMWMPLSAQAGARWEVLVRYVSGLSLAEPG